MAVPAAHVRHHHTGKKLYVIVIYLLYINYSNIAIRYIHCSLDGAALRFAVSAAHSRRQRSGCRSVLFRICTNNDKCSIIITDNDKC